VNIVVVDSMLEVDFSTDVMTPLEQEDAAREVSTEVTVTVIGVQAQIEAAGEDDEAEKTTEVEDGMTVLSVETEAAGEDNETELTT